jgi:serine/threonine protein kinase
MPQLIDGYQITRTLGKGAQAKVKLAKHIDSGETFAIKLMFDPKAID